MNLLYFQGKGVINAESSVCMKKALPTIQGSAHGGGGGRAADSGGDGLLFMPGASWA